MQNIPEVGEQIPVVPIDSDMGLHSVIVSSVVIEWTRGRISFGGGAAPCILGWHPRVEEME